jgi:hypothetical protein
MNSVYDETFVSNSFQRLNQNIKIFYYQFFTIKINVEIDRVPTPKFHTKLYLLQIIIIYNQADLKGRIIQALLFFVVIHALFCMT